MSGLTIENISMIHFVRGFQFDEGIRRKQFEFEDALRSIFKDPPKVAQSTSNLASTAPRFVFADNKKSLYVTGEVVQFALNFTEGFPAKTSLSDLLMKYASVMDSIGNDILSYQEVYYTGIVIAFHGFGYKDRDDVAFHIAKELFNGTIEKPKAMNLLLSCEEDGLLYTTTVAGCDRYSKRLEKGQTSVSLNSQFEVPDESGLEIKIDINSRLKAQSDEKGDFSSLPPLLIQAFKDKFPNMLNGLSPII